MSNNKIVQRLLQYRTCLEHLDELGFERVYSHTLGAESGVSPEQVRKDFSKFCIKGNRRGGYEIRKLMATLDKTFGKHKVQQTVLVGMGNLGRALSGYRGFMRKKIEIVAAFDIDPAKIGKKYSIPVYDMQELEGFLKQNRVWVAILAVPESKAQEVCDTLVQSGIAGIMNFSPIILKVPEEVMVNNINLSNELEGLVYHVLNKETIHAAAGGNDVGELT